jgi:hypothetical protein
MEREQIAEHAVGQDVVLRGSGADRADVLRELHNREVLVRRLREMMRARPPVMP